jgi:hypothetical protein
MEEQEWNWMVEVEFLHAVEAIVWIELVERVDCLIKDYIMRDIDSTFGDIETLKPFMQGVVPQEYALLGAELELMRVERSQIRPASTTKCTKPTVVCFS